MNVDEIPFPPEATQGTIDGRYEVELDAATNSILADLKKNYSTVNEKILFLPADADAAKIFAFYELKLSDQNLSKDAKCSCARQKLSNKYLAKRRLARRRSGCRCRH